MASSAAGPRGLLPTLWPFGCCITPSFLARPRAGRTHSTHPPEIAVSLPRQLFRRTLAGSHLGALVSRAATPNMVVPLPTVVVVLDSRSDLTLPVSRVIPSPPFCRKSPGTTGLRGRNLYGNATREPRTARSLPPRTQRADARCRSHGVSHKQVGGGASGARPSNPKSRSPQAHL